MNRFVLDTDVIIAALRSPSGASAALLAAARDRQLVMLASVPCSLRTRRNAFLQSIGPRRALPANGPMCSSRVHPHTGSGSLLFRPAQEHPELSGLREVRRGGAGAVERLAGAARPSRLPAQRAVSRAKALRDDDLLSNRSKKGPPGPLGEDARQLRHGPAAPL